MALHKRWQHDHVFVLWMVGQEYATRTAKGEVRSNVSEGVAIYMWEAWTAGQDRMAKVLGVDRA